MGHGLHTQAIMKNMGGITGARNNYAKGIEGFIVKKKVHRTLHSSEQQY